MALPVLAAMGLAVGSTLARAGGSAIAAALDPTAKRNRERLEEIRSGTAKEKELRSALAPVRTLASQAQSEAARLSTATGELDAGTAARLGERSDRMVADAAMNAARGVDVALADEEAQLVAAQSQRQADMIDSITGALAEGAGAAGAILGAPPGTYSNPAAEAAQATHGNNWQGMSDQQRALAIALERQKKREAAHQAALDRIRQRRAKKGR